MGLIYRLTTDGIQNETMQYLTNKSITRTVNNKDSEVKSMKNSILKQLKHCFKNVFGGPRGRVVKSADISLSHLTIRSSHRCVWCGFEPALATCETSQVLLAGVSGGFSRGSPVFAPPTDWPVSYELK